MELFPRHLLVLLRVRGTKSCFSISFLFGFYMICMSKFSQYLSLRACRGSARFFLSDGSSVQVSLRGFRGSCPFFFGILTTNLFAL